MSDSSFSLPPSAFSLVDTLSDADHAAIQILGAQILSNLKPPRTPEEWFHECAERDFYWIVDRIRTRAMKDPDLAMVLDKLADHEVWTVLLEDEKPF